MVDVEHACRKHLEEIKTIICSSTSSKDGIHAAEEQLKELLDVAKGHRALWMPVLKTLINNPSKDRLFAVKKALQDLSFHNEWQWKENWRDGQALIQEITEVGELRQQQGDNFTDVVTLYSEIVLLLIKQMSDAKVADNVSLDVVELYITMMETGSEVINLLPSNLAPVLPSFKVFKDKIPALFKRFEILFLKNNYPWEQVNTDNAGFHFVSHVVDAYETSSQIPAEVNKSFSAIFGRCLGPDNVSFIHQGDDCIVIYRKLVSFMTPFCKPNEKVRSKKVLKPLVPVVVKMVKNQGDDYVYQVGLSAIQIIAQMKSDLLVEYLDSIIQWYKRIPNPFALTVLSTIYRENGDEVDKERFPELFAAILQDGEHMKMHIHVLWEIAGKTPEVFTEDNIVEMINFYIDDNVATSLMLGILAKITLKFPERLSPDLIIEMLFGEMKFQEMNALYLTNVAVNVGIFREAYVDTFIKELIAFNKKCKTPLLCTNVINGIKTLGEKCGMDKLKPYRAYLEDVRQNCDSAELKSAVDSTIDAMENRSLAKVSGEVKQQGKKVSVLDKKVTKTTKEVAVVKQNVKKHEVQITNVKVGLKTVNKRVDVVEEDLSETKVKVEEIDKKTMTNAPAWSRDVTKLMNPQAEHDWRLLASRLGYSNNDIKGWATQNDPCMALLSEWYATHKTIEATHGVLTALQEMNRMDAAAIVENAMKAVEGIVEEAPEYTTPPPIFLSYQWGHQNEVKLLRNHLQMAGYECWMDIGQMGGGDKLFEKIDNGIRGAKIIICCVSEKYAKSPNCNREVNLSVNLGKPMIPLLMEKMGWPPKGSMGPIFSEYLFIRFFQRGGEETKDDRYWPVPKFQELLMQINLEVLPDDALVTKEYKEWWKPMAEEIIIVKKEDKGQGSQLQQTPDSGKEEDKSPDVFISYQWGKQPQIKQLYRRLVELGFTCWMDIYQMGGGDSLYDKIDRGVRGCKIVLSCVTTKYALSANCRREVSLADSIKKPIIPLLLEKIDWPPTGPMSMVFTQLLFINFYRDEKVQMTWTGDKFDELLGKIKESVPHLFIPENTEAKPGQKDNEKSEKGEQSPEVEKNSINVDVAKQDTPVEEPPKPAEVKSHQQTEVPKTVASRKSPEPVKVASSPSVPKTESHGTPKSEEIHKETQRSDADLGTTPQFHKTQNYTPRSDEVPKREPEIATKKSSACVLL